ncbi:MAG: histidine kinase [Rothia sp. (in: high G+C Gram-positive bacteria)]|nr:histidine kinase [Rothia sp. (in: high G+C Gram-positive bacteria)]
MSIFDIIRNIRFTPPSRWMAGVLLLITCAFFILDILYFREGVTGGIPAILLVIIPASYMLSAILLLLKKPYAVVFIWICMIAAYFNPLGDEYWYVVILFSIALHMYTMCSVFWVPTFVLFLVYFIFQFADDFFFQPNEISSDANPSARLITIISVFSFVIIPVLLRIQNERTSVQKVQYEQHIEAVYYASNEQRKELARELHDVVAHELTIIAMQSRTAKFSDEAVKNDILAIIGDQSRNALQELRRLLAVMRVEKDSKMLASEHQAMSADLLRVIERQSKQLENLGYKVTHQVTGNFDMVPKSFVPTISRVIAESVTNAIKHGRIGGQVELSLAAQKDSLDYTLVNDLGRGRESMQFPTSGYGLRGLSERVLPLGGTLLSEEVEGNRWKTFVSLPYDT